MAQRFAVIDLGSNSFRLVVYAWSGGRWRRTDEIFEPVRIGAGVDETGALNDDAIARALATVEVFAAFARASGLGPDELGYVATSAIRDATNRDEFLERARAVTGTDVRVLSGEEEAYYGYLAAVNSSTLADGAVLDLGGGSLQLVRVVGRLEAEAVSWPLGAVRMTERFLPGDGPATAKQLGRLRAHVASRLESAPWLATSQRLVAIGGTARTLAAADQRARALPDLGGVGGHVIGADGLDALIEELAAMAPEERASVPGVKPARADLILAGAVVIRTAMETCGVAGIEVTEAGLREGVFFERSIDADPPLLDDVRMASVLNLAAHYGIDAPHTEHVARLATGLFDELAAGGLHPGDALERELVWAAAVLHDIGMAVDYDDHHKHTRYLILNGGLPGFSPREVALIAQITRYHRKGLPSLGELAPLTDKRDDALLDRGAVLVRLAEDLERSRDQSVREVHATIDEDTVRLALVSDDDVRVPRWAASREGPLFERAFGRRLEITERRAATTAG